jgi:CRISPR-associated endoribonuclease Cas6
MRFVLTLRPLAHSQQLLFNYQYPFMAWIYGRLKDADEDYANFLHNIGYKATDSRKTFKHFTFSSFRIPHLAKPIKKGDTCMWLGKEPISVIVSFFIEKAAEDFIMGLFQNQTFGIYDTKHQANFVIERVESLPNEVFDNQAILMRTISPMVIAEKRKDGKDEYLSPNDPRFAKYFALNLLEKFNSVYENDLKIDAETASHLIKFKLVDGNRLKSRLISIKDNKADGTKVRAFTNFVFEVSAPPQVLEVGFFGGFGKYSTHGMGCCEVVV